MNVNEDLRAWARGMYTTEAAAELLIRVFNGRFADSQNPWIQLDDDHRDPGHWVDFASIPEHVTGFSSGEQRILRIVASIGSTEVDINLSDDLSGLDRSALRLVLAAIAHAAGSHEHSDMIIDHDNGTCVLVRQPSLYAWDGHDTSDALSSTR